jgi:hypothetical protein
MAWLRPSAYHCESHPNEACSVLHSKPSTSELLHFVRTWLSYGPLVASAILFVWPHESHARDLLVADRLTNSVYRYSDTGMLLGTVVGSADGLNANLNQPAGIGISTDSKELLVSSSQNSIVMKYDYDAATGKASNPTVFADASDGLAFPNDIKFSPGGNKVYVANLGGGGIARFNVDGSSAGSELPMPDGAATPATSMVFTSTRQLLAGEFEDSTGAAGAIATSDRSVSTFSLFAAAADINGATGLMVHGGYLYVSGLFGSNIRRFKLSDGSIDASWGISGVSFPQDLVETPDGNGFLAGVLGQFGGGGSISRYSFDGTFVGTFAMPGSGGFSEATAFAFVPTPVIGDFVNDTFVDAADYVAWRNATPTTTLSNDRTPGVVDASDYADWRANFGKTRTASSAGLGAAVVPEPATALLLLVGMMSGGILRVRR